MAEGSRSANDAPALALSSVNVPPCSSAICRATARPSPDDSSRDRVVTKGSNNRSATSGSMRSVIRDSHHDPTGRRLELHANRAILLAGQRLFGVDDQIQHGLQEKVRKALHIDDTGLRRRVDDRQPGATDRKCTQADGAHRHLAHAHTTGLIGFLTREGHDVCDGEARLRILSVNAPQSVRD